MQINKLYISLKHWPALPPHGLAEKACRPLWRLLLGPQVLDLFLFGKKSFRRFYSVWKSFRHASAISHSRNMQPKSPQKKREKRERTILLSFSTLVLQSSTRLFQLVPGIADKMQC